VDELGEVGCQFGRDWLGDLAEIPQESVEDIESRLAGFPSV
jgi:hypothetical protein